MSPIVEDYWNHRSRTALLMTLTLVLTPILPRGEPLPQAPASQQPKAQKPSEPADSGWPVSTRWRVAAPCFISPRSQVRRGRNTWWDGRRCPTKHRERSNRRSHRLFDR
jgi:hypothetical protein